VRTTADQEGPYYVSGAPYRNGSICSANVAGETLIVSGRVLDGSGCSIGLPATLDIWQADNTGQYSDRQSKECRAKVTTDAQGNFRYKTIVPAKYSMDGALRPSHIHYKITPFAGYGTLTTQMYFRGDTSIYPNDPCGRSCKSSSPSLIVDKRPTGFGIYEANFNIVMNRRSFI